MRYWRTTELIDGITADELARRTRRTIDSARSAARRHGIKLQPKRRGYPDSARERALRLRSSGRTFPEIAKAVGASPRTVQNWVYGRES